MTAWREHPAVAMAFSRFPGAEIVDVRDAEPESPPAPAAEAGGKVSLAAIAELLAAEARRIRAAQEGLVAEGDRDEPHAGQLYKARCFDAAEKVMRAVAGDPIMTERLRAALARG